MGEQVSCDEIEIEIEIEIEVSMGDPWGCPTQIEGTYLFEGTYNVYNVEGGRGGLVAAEAALHG